MKRKWKIILPISLRSLLIAGGVYGGRQWSQRDLVTVQTGVAARADLTAIVTASGEIKPRTYINIGANAQGRITELSGQGRRPRPQESGGRAHRTYPGAGRRGGAESRWSRPRRPIPPPPKTASRPPTRPFTTGEATLERFKTELTRAKMLLDNADQMYQIQPDRQTGLRSEESRLRVGPGQRSRKRGAAGADESAARADRGATDLLSAPRGPGRGRA